MLAACISAETISVNGTVTTMNGTGIPGVELTLVNAGITATSDSIGKFSFSGSYEPAGTVRHRLRLAGTSPVHLKDNALTLQVSNAGPVSVSVYAPDGKQLYVFSRNEPAGVSRIVLPPQSAGLRIFKITANGTTMHFPAVSSIAGSGIVQQKSVSSATPLSTAAATGDVAIATKDAFLSGRFSIKSYSEKDVILKMLPLDGQMTDAEGNSYQCVRFGNQLWTVENLRTTKFSDGTPIPVVTDAEKWVALTTSACCFFGNRTDSVLIRKWGALYNWFTVKDSRGLAPEGWRVPSNADWEKLMVYIAYSDNGYNLDTTYATEKCAKALCAQTEWASEGSGSYATVGTPGKDLALNNKSGFSAYPAGCRYAGGYGFSYELGYWWCSDEKNEKSGCMRYLYYNYNDMRPSSADKTYGISVRLVHDLSPDELLPFDGRTVTVRYMKNGAVSGTVPPSVTISAGEKIQISSNSGNLLKPAYTFTGWNTAADGSGVRYAEGAEYIADNTLVLYPTWITTGRGPSEPPVWGDTLSDIDGNSYPTIRIGNQWWTTRNLKTGTYNDGTPVAYIEERGSSTTTGWNNQTSGAYCYYNNDPADADTFGALYNWFAASDARLAPEGWRVPSKADWDTLRYYLTANGYLSDSTINSKAGIAKAIADTAHWDSSTTKGTIGCDRSLNNSTRFSAVPTGSRMDNGNFSPGRVTHFLWSSSPYEHEDNKAYGFTLNYGSSELTKSTTEKVCGYSIRLVRDAE